MKSQEETVREVAVYSADGPLLIHLNWMTSDLVKRCSPSPGQKLTWALLALRGKHTPPHTHIHTHVCLHVCSVQSKLEQ